MVYKYLAALVILSLALVLGFTLRKPSVAKVTVTNGSSQEISSLRVSLKHNNLVKEKLGVNHVADFQFKIKSDDHYHVKVYFKDGSEIDKQLGYVTSGMDSNDKITIFDSDIEISSVEN
jgi:hypothetical protein